MNNKNVSNLIKTRRKEEKITQQEFANKVGVSLMTVVRWENGIRTPNSALMPKIAEALNTTVSYLMGLDNNSEKNILLSSDLSESPNMAYWGGVLDNAKVAAENNENLNTIYTLLSDALGVIKTAMGQPV